MRFKTQMKPRGSKKPRGWRIKWAVENLPGGHLLMRMGFRLDAQFFKWAVFLCEPVEYVDQFADD